MDRLPASPTAVFSFLRRTNPNRSKLYGLVISVIFAVVASLLAGFSGPVTQLSGQAIGGPVGILDKSPAAGPVPSAPVLFIENVGQFDERDRFRLQGAGGTIHFATDAVWISLLEREMVLDGDADGSGDLAPAPRKGVNLRLSFVGSNPRPRVEGVGRVNTEVFYFLGNESRPHQKAPAWQGVRYVDLYPGVDLEVTNRQGGWAWRLAPRTDGARWAQNVRLQVEGANEVALQADRLQVETSFGALSLPLLEVASQRARPGLRAAMVQGNQINAPFLSPRAAEERRDIRPFLFSTLLGGSANERANGVAIDPTSKAVYVTGRTESPDFPDAVGEFSGAPNDVYVTKLRPDGSVEFSAFLGGDGDDQGFDITVEPGGGHVYLAGRTSSTDFPTFPVGDSVCPSYDCRPNGFYDAFVVRLTAAGTIAYGTYLGGELDDFAYGVAVDPHAPGTVYVTGMTASSNFPVESRIGAEVLDGSFSGNQESFLVKLDTNLAGTASLRYSTFLGGNVSDQGHDIEVDSLGGQIYLVGQTESDDLAAVLSVGESARGYSTTYSGGFDAFLVRLRASDFRVEYFTYLGGTGNDCEVPGDFRECRIALGADGAVFLTGMTSSEVFPTTPSAYKRLHSEEGHFGYDAFLAKIDTDFLQAGSLMYSTLLGGRGDEFAYGLAVNSRGEALVVGRTESCDFPVSPSGLRPFFEGGDEGFLTKFDSRGRSVLYSTFLGGVELDSLIGISLDGESVAHVIGWTRSPDFPTTDPERSLLGESDALVLAFDVPSRAAEPVFQLDPREGNPRASRAEGVSHLFWPFENSVYASPCLMDAGPCEESVPEAPLVCWGPNVTSESSCHELSDFYARDWRLCNFLEPNCARFQTACQTTAKIFRSPVDGKVLFTGDGTAYGSQITLQVYLNGAPTQFALRVAHFQEGSFFVGRGEMVARGDALGRVGKTGASSGDFNHAHTVLYKNLEARDLETLERGGLFESLPCTGRPETERAAKYVLDAVRSPYLVEYLFEDDCAFDKGLVPNSGSSFRSLAYGVIQGPPAQFGDFGSLVERSSGKAWELSGLHYLEVPNSERIHGQGFGVEAFVWRESNDEEDPVASKGGQWRLSFQPDGPAGRLVFTVRLRGQGDFSIEYEPLDATYLQSWVRVAATYTVQGGLRLYWNGEPAVEGHPRGGRALELDQELIRIGAARGASGFRGRLDNVRFWSFTEPCFDC